MRPTIHLSSLYDNMEDGRNSELVVNYNPSLLYANTVPSKEKDELKIQQFEKFKRFFQKNKDKYSDEDDILKMGEYWNRHLYLS